MLYILAIVEQQYLGNIALQSQQLDTRPFSHLVGGACMGTRLLYTDEACVHGNHFICITSKFDHLHFENGN